MGKLIKLAGCCLAGYAVFGPASAASQNYNLTANDLVEITVYQEDDLRTTARVADDGTITFPLIGSVRIGGKSVEEAAQAIRGRLAKDYLVNPQVNLTVTEYAKRRFTVLGQVEKSGTYDFPDHGSLDLLQAIGMAGGYTRIADAGRITVRRNSSGRETVFRLNAKEMAAGKSGATFEVLPGDTVTVGESVF